MKRRMLLSVALLVPAIVLGQVAKLAPELTQASGEQSVSVIVQYKVAPGVKQQSRIQANQGTVNSSMQLIKGLQAQVPQTALAALSTDPDVAYITPDRPVRSHMNNAALAVLANYGWGMGLDGTRVGVAVIDSGITAVADLNSSANTSRVRYSADFTGDGPGDGYGHGTHVAGIIGGNGAGSTCDICTVTIQGIAPNVDLISLKALNNQGEGTDSTVIAAIQAAIKLKSTYNIRVINLSLGRAVYESYQNDPLCQAVEQAWKAGIVVVVSAGNGGRDNTFGNSGYGTIESPGNDPYVITVGATNTKGTPDRGDDVMATYSSKGPTAIDHIVKPDIVAPGNRIVSLYTPGALETQSPQNQVRLSYYQNTGNADLSPSYFVLSGTSMAAGVVSGAAALMIQQDSTLTPDLVKARLMKTAYKSLPRYSTVVDQGAVFNLQTDMFTVGAGFLDIQAALLNKDKTTATAKSPAASFDATSGNVALLSDTTTAWGQAAMWARLAPTSPTPWVSTAVWGSDAFVGNATLGGSPSTWASSAMWGNSAMWGTSAMWGNSAMWGTSAMWGGSAMWGTQIESSGEN